MKYHYFDNCMIFFQTKKKKYYTSGLTKRAWREPNASLSELFLMHNTITIMNMASNPNPHVNIASTGVGTPDFEVGNGVADWLETARESSG